MKNETNRTTTGRQPTAPKMDSRGLGLAHRVLKFVRSWRRDEAKRGQAEFADQASASFFAGRQDHGERKLQPVKKSAGSRNDEVFFGVLARAARKADLDGTTGEILKQISAGGKGGRCRELDNPGRLANALRRISCAENALVITSRYNRHKNANVYSVRLADAADTQAA